VKVSKAPIDVVIAPLAFHEPNWTAAIHDDEVDLAPVGVAEVAELDLTAAGILLEVDPLEQMRGDEVLEPRGVPWDERPV
jgi:hypothetical protein